MRNRISEIPLIIVFLFALALTCGSAQDIRELQQRFDAVSKVVQDPLTDEGGIRKSLRELEQLAKLTQEFEEGDLQPDNPRANLAKGIVNTLRQVESRLPADFKRRSGELRPGFPIPEFDDRKLLAGHAAKLDDAQKNLARHLRRTDDPGDQAEELLHAVSIAQEALAWEAGWPFTREEAEQVRAAGRLTPEAYQSRLKRGIKRINEQISGERQANGRAGERLFTVHLSANDEGKKQFAEHLEKLRQVELIPGESFREFDKEEANILTGGPAR